MGEFHESFNKLLFKTYPSCKEIGSIDLSRVVTDKTIKLDSAVLKNIQDCVRTFSELSNHKCYKDSVLKNHKAFADLNYDSSSVLMAFDFHIDESSSKCHLIEINTNASGYLLSDLLYQHQSQSGHLDTLKNSFIQEAKLLSLGPDIHCGIIDENLKNQKMLVEFYMYKDLLNSINWNTQIIDVAEIDHHLQSLNFIYNRFCDFTFKQPEAKTLLEAYQSKRIGISPHPISYILLADKNRLKDLSNNNWWEDHPELFSFRNRVSKFLIPTLSADDFANLEEIWHQRKSLFFKPSQSYGGKSTYRGQSISRGAFERLFDQPGTLIQKYIPAPTREFADQDSKNTQKWKFDVRAYTYKEDVQMVIARVYQGQVTNFSSPGGGFASISF